MSLAGPPTTPTLKVPVIPEADMSTPSSTPVAFNGIVPGPTAVCRAALTDDQVVTATRMGKTSMRVMSDPPLVGRCKRATIATARNVRNVPFGLAKMRIAVPILAAGRADCRTKADSVCVLAHSRRARPGKWRRTYFHHRLRVVPRSHSRNSDCGRNPAGDPGSFVPERQRDHTGQAPVVVAR